MRRTLWLDLVLNNQGLALVVHLLGKLGRDGVVGSGILQHQALVALDTLENGRLLNRPLSNVDPVLIGSGVFLLGMRWGPSLFPVVGELL